MKVFKCLISFLILLIGGGTLIGQHPLCQGSFWTEDEANLVMKRFEKAWTDLESWEVRADSIRSVIKNGMNWERMEEMNVDFDPIIHSSRKMDGYIVENISIVSFRGFYITGNLYRPDRDGQAWAGILSPHGHWENGRMREDMQLRCASFARMGAVVFAYDMIGYGDSQQVEHDIPIALLLQTWNSHRVLSYLSNRDDVDSGRIGITGASGGGTQSFLLSAIDKRVSVAVPVVMVSAHFFGGCTCESAMPIHARSDGFQTNNVEIAASIAPRPMMLISVGGDWTRNTPRIEYPYISKVYALYDKEHRVENVHLSGELHDYGRSKRSAAYIFMARHLNLDLTRLNYDEGFNEDFVTILSERELRVFNNERMIPDDALLDSHAILKALRFEE